MLFQQLQEAHLLLDLHGNFCGLATEDGFILFLSTTIRNKDHFFFSFPSTSLPLQRTQTELNNHASEQAIQKISTSLLGCFGQPQPLIPCPFPQLPAVSADSKHMQCAPRQHQSPPRHVLALHQELTDGQCQNNRPCLFCHPCVLLFHHAHGEAEARPLACMECTAPWDERPGPQLSSSVHCLQEHRQCFDYHVYNIGWRLLEMSTSAGNSVKTFIKTY